MTERVDIANLALGWLGEQAITSLEDDSDRARQMKLNYIPARDATLEAYEWSFAIKRFVPAQNVLPPAYGPSYAFDVPHDILRVLTCDRSPFLSEWHPVSDVGQVDWILEGDQILTDEPAIYCRGIRRVEEEGRFSNLFVHALAAKLAALTALNLTSSTATLQLMMQMHMGFISDAKSRDGMQGRNRRVHSSYTLRVR